MGGKDGQSHQAGVDQPLDYDLKRKVEWRFANGKPFAVIYRIDLTKGDDGPDISYSDVTITQWEPQERSY